MNFEKLLGQQAFRSNLIQVVLSGYLHLMFLPGVLPSLMAVSIESFHFSVNIWPQILEKTLDILDTRKGHYFITVEVQ